MGSVLWSYPHNRETILIEIFRENPCIFPARIRVGFGSNRLGVLFLGYHADGAGLSEGNVWLRWRASLEFGCAVSAGFLCSGICDFDRGIDSTAKKMGASILHGQTVFADSRFIHTRIFSIRCLLGRFYL